VKFYCCLCQKGEIRPVHPSAAVCSSKEEEEEEEEEEAAAVSESIDSFFFLYPMCLSRGGGECYGTAAQQTSPASADSCE
jgi:hypothetical protein